MNDFNIGFLASTITWFLIIGGMCWFHRVQEESGYTDKMVISYHCPDKTYERALFRQVVNASGVQTNFVNQQTSMDKHWIRIKLTNPKKD